MWLGFGFEDDEDDDLVDSWCGEAKRRMALKRKIRNAVGGKKAAKAARKKTSARSRRAKGSAVRATKRARRMPRAARAKNSPRRRPVRRVNAYHPAYRATQYSAKWQEALDRAARLRRAGKMSAARKASATARKWKAKYDKIHGAASRALNRRDSLAKKNAFGLDRFVGRKKRVTSETYQRAGSGRRSRAYQKAGVPKKLSSTYANLDWKDLQQLEPGFVKKVMRSLNPRSLAKLRSQIGSKIRQLRSEGVPQKQAIAIALREARTGYLKPKAAYSRRGRRNPDEKVPGIERAGEKYAMFHGRGPSRTVEVKELAPKDMAALGDLESLILGKKDYQIHWGKGERPLLAVDADVDQLYIVGGNQQLPESLLTELGVSGKVDVLDLGEINQIEYFTQKDFDNFKPIVYYHQFGEEDAKKNPRGVRRPRLLYSRRYRKLMIAGGAYKVKKEGIIN